ncbi:hypothetical protein [Bradyrhizobium sp. BR 1432]|uniref:hypothetical protein n=1 Tax=Bradyrhizobium sp. BR 1432 TaxID=3447966 RepID=UPI003EE42E37
MSPELQIELKNAAATPRFLCAVICDAGNVVTRHCEPTGPREAPPDDRLREAIQTVTAAGFWIASSQGLLAMTVLREPRSQ